MSDAADPFHAPEQKPTLPGATGYSPRIGAELPVRAQYTFTHKLSFDEYREQLPPGSEKERAYWRWLFGINEPICARRELDQAQPTRDWDKTRAIRNDEDFEVTPTQHGSGR